MVKNVNFCQILVFFKKISIKTLTLFYPTFLDEYSPKEVVVVGGGGWNPPHAKNMSFQHGFLQVCSICPINTEKEDKEGER